MLPLVPVEEISPGVSVLLWVSAVQIWVWLWLALF